jgi:tripartite-type tricarboxylate transporter receptor subunit TctC
LAITGNRRLAALPDVPTFAELGHPNILGTSYSLNAPIGTPAIALNKLRNAASRVLQQQNVKAAFAAYGREIVNEEPPEAALKSMAALAKVYAEAAKAAGIQPE